jgi:hypothetical protein
MAIRNERQIQLLLYLLQQPECKFFAIEGGAGRKLSEAAGLDGYHALNALTAVRNKGYVVEDHLLSHNRRGHMEYRLTPEGFQEILPYARERGIAVDSIPPPCLPDEHRVINDRTQATQSTPFARFHLSSNAGPVSESDEPQAADDGYIRVRRDGRLRRIKVDTVKPQPRPHVKRLLTREEPKARELIRYLRGQDQPVLFSAGGGLEAKVAGLLELNVDATLLLLRHMASDGKLLYFAMSRTVYALALPRERRNFDQLVSQVAPASKKSRSGSAKTGKAPDETEELAA